jgi:predicted RNA-binding protein with TRAM domain
MIAAGATLTLDVEKATAGGRMLARHQGQVVLVWGAIPGERVDARVERTGKGVAYAETIAVRTPSPDRRAETVDWRCGGNVLAHVDYARQLRLKGEIIQDAFARIGRMPLAKPPLVTPSREDGYRMRARLHAHNGRLGFYREGSHDVCGAAGTRQLLSSTNAWIERAEAIIEREARAQLIAIEIAENIAGDERACHLELHEGTDASRYAPLADGLVGLSARYADHAETVMLSGTPVIHDLVEVRHGDARTSLRTAPACARILSGQSLSHHDTGSRGRRRCAARSRNRSLRRGRAAGLSLAATRSEPVTLVEGDAISAPISSSTRLRFRDRFVSSGGASRRFLRTSTRAPPPPSCSTRHAPDYRKTRWPASDERAHDRSCTCRATSRRSRAMHAGCSTQATRSTVWPRSTCFRIRHTLKWLPCSLVRRGRLQAARREKCRGGSCPRFHQLFRIRLCGSSVPWIWRLCARR